MDTDESAATGSEIDLSRAPLGVKVASALVKAVAASDDRVERHYLEVKSGLDLTQKNDIAKIAKFILGAANRMPSVAGAAFEGYGVMVIGVAAGEIHGVPPIEVLDLDQTISRYIGMSGPRWDVVRVPVPESNNDVLVVVVDPPQDGQDPFPCRKEGEKLLGVMQRWVTTDFWCAASEERMSLCPLPIPKSSAMTWSRWPVAVSQG